MALMISVRDHIINLPANARSKTGDGRVYFYALKHPDTGNVRYIGKTIRPVTRYRRHIIESETHKTDHHCARWIRILLAAGIFPIMEILEVADIDDDWQGKEKAWISKFREMGAELTNIMAGGQGAQNPDSEWRNAVSARMKGNQFNKGRKHSDETREVIRQAHLGRKFTDEHKRKIGQNWAGRKHKPESIEKLRNRIVSQETRDKISKAKRARDAAKCKSS